VGYSLQTASASRSDEQEEGEAETNLRKVLVLDVSPRLRRDTQILPHLNGTGNVSDDGDALSGAELVYFRLRALRDGLAFDVEVLSAQEWVSEKTER
jgi:hypothetical protein